MIAYSKKIVLRENRNGEWILESDRGSRYLTAPIINTRTPITDWWEKNNHSDLREWQMDAVVKTLGNSFNTTIIPFIVYKKGNGYSQPHDITLVRFDTIWVLSTQKDLWINSSNQGEIIFDIKDSLGSILDPKVRKIVYAIADQIELEKQSSYA